jgi:hypothetical protein
MMTLTGCGIPLNRQLNLHSTTKLVVDVTISHTYNHTFKLNVAMETSKRYKYDYHYLRQRLPVAFAPMPVVANTLGQCRPNVLRFHWNLSDHRTCLNLGFSIETTNSMSTKQSMN